MEKYRRAADRTAKQSARRCIAAVLKNESAAETADEQRKHREAVEANEKKESERLNEAERVRKAEQAAARAARAAARVSVKAKLGSKKSSSHVARAGTSANNGK